MKKNIKILHVIASLGNGGAERQLVELLRHNKHHGVLLLYKAGFYKKILDDLDISYWELGIKTKFLFKELIS